MKAYHRTPFPESILENGFRDSEGTYMTGQSFRGVWVSNYPLDCQEGAKGRYLIRLDVPESILKEYEWIEEGKPYREFLVPAAILNKHKPLEMCDPDAEDEMDDSNYST